MLAYTYFKNHTLKLYEKPVPVLQGGDAIIKVIACSICGTDVRTYRFGSSKIDEGRTIGHEVVGIITELSADAPGNFQKGDHVAVAPAIGCGACYCCKTGHTNMCEDLHTIGYQYDGGFAEYMRIPARALNMGNVYKLPNVEDYTFYTLSEPLACAINAQSYLNINKEDDVVIFGSGIIGCMHAELALHAGARSIYIAETSDERINEAGKLLDKIHFINSNIMNVGEEIRRMTGGKGADVAIIACSVGKAQTDAMNLLAKRGRISLFGGLPGESNGFIDSNLIHYREISVYGVHASTPEQNQKAMTLIYNGDIDVKKYITKRYYLEEVDQAFTDINGGKVMKAIIVNR